ncbi:MAG TPA: hypothetical protein VMF52_14175 [Steroidobacteraceae bacterium]|nr:hypothetical protein [Steroidobacteraceae bacterium]
MKVWKIVLALALAGGVVAAYLNFPNPLEQEAAAVAAEKQKAAESPAKDAPQPTAEAAPAGGGESI